MRLPEGHGVVCGALLLAMICTPKTDDLPDMIDCLQPLTTTSFAFRMKYSHIVKAWRRLMPLVNQTGVGPPGMCPFALNFESSKRRKAQ
jgi:hypothetical protein